MAAEDYDKMSASEKKKEDWMNSKWRPMMGWMYMVTCMCDFVIFPILWSGLQAALKMPQMTQWMPLTLQGAGLFHIAMGAVLGIAAYGRTQEKLNGANNGGISLPSSGIAAPSPATSNFGPSGFGSAPTPTPAATGFGGGFGSTPSPAPAPAASGFSGGFAGAPTTVMSSSGKLGPAPQQDPVL